jgi:hypothetical protein
MPDHTLQFAFASQTATTALKWNALKRCQLASQAFLTTSIVPKRNLTTSNATTSIIEIIAVTFLINCQTLNKNKK